jgi:hypothetical protein
MLRIVRDFVPQPVFFLLCDERTCANAATRLVNLSVDLNEEARAFVETAIAGGWSINLDAHICPSHVAASSREALITVPRPAVLA